MKKLLDAIPGNNLKTYITAIIALVSGIGGLILYCTDSENSLAVEPSVAWTMILFGLGLLGVGHKVDKLRNGQ
jgi:hypothetical protein